MTPVPRMIEGWPCKTLSGGLVWGCDRGAMLRLGCYEHDFSHGFVMSGDDMLCRVQWYRELYMGLKPSWFVADPPDRVACFSHERLFRRQCGLHYQAGGTDLLLSHQRRRPSPPASITTSRYRSPTTVIFRSRNTVPSRQVRCIPMNRTCFGSAT